uniref:Family with sequence similarity 163 member B n=1 Tax=Cynoglossus semilaevis TaxID=244447 RepID=A0A3P8WGF6_CYNSE
MTAGTVVITGGILATVILLLIIAVLCYCRLQYYCCKKEESESEEEEPDFAVTSRLPPVHSNHKIVATFCPSCTHYEMPFYLQPPQPQVHHQPDGLRNGGERISYRSVQQQDLELPVPVNISNYRKPNLSRSVTMRDMFTRSCSISTDV